MEREVKTYYIRTYGCQMNELDTQIMRGQLEKRGLAPASDEGEADLLIFNTCAIRDLAERKVMGKLGKLGQKKAIRSRKKVIGVTGCMANAKKESFFQKMPHVDFVLGTNNLGELNTVLDTVLQTGEQTLLADTVFKENVDYLSSKRDSKVMAYVSIIRGCNKHCTYCVVPYTRGREVSRPPESIVEECRQLVDQGYKEVMLLGQNVNSYGKDMPQWNCLFHDLLAKLDAINGLERVRFLTSHPVDITRELMEAIRDLPSLCELVHFPIQAGSNRILRKMHRIYTKEEYLEKVALFREIAPHVLLGTDIIVGFPTETEEEFQETYEVLKQIEYALAFVFTYSPRKGTPAIRWQDDIPEEVKLDRHHRLMELQNGILAGQMSGYLGRDVEVLVEGRNRKDGKQLKGHTRCWRNVIFEGDSSLIGSLQTVKIHSFNHNTLIGTTIN